MHVKTPRCDCGCRLLKHKRNIWKCPCCNREYKESDMLDPIVVEYLDFAPDDEEEDFIIIQDYGEYLDLLAYAKPDLIRMSITMSLTANTVLLKNLIFESKHYAP